MKTIKQTLVILLGLVFVGNFRVEAQPSGHFQRPTNSPFAVLQNHALTNLPGASFTISNILAAPAAAKTIPQISRTNITESGTFWTIQSAGPLPGNMFPTLPVYALDITNRIFLIDDRSVDYLALQARQDAEDATNGSANRYSANSLLIDTNWLWLEVPTNSLVESNQFNVVIRSTIAGKSYDVMTKPDLSSPTWNTEQTVTATGETTPVTLMQNERTNLFVWARETIIPINTQPLAQEVFSGDSVTFTVVADGSGLFYQWTFNGTNIVAATGSSYTINNVNESQAGNYACFIHNADGSVTSQAATLIVYPGSGWSYLTATIGQRQDYTFRSGVTYNIDSLVQLHGYTTIEGGAIIKFDHRGDLPCLQIMGTLECKGGLYYPAVLTSVDDNAFGEPESGNSPQPVYTGVPYLDLTYAGDVSLNHVRFRFADMAVSTPYHARLDVGDSQFFECYAGVVNEFGGVTAFHNVLFAGCYEAVMASTNSFSIEAEHLTANVYQLWESSVPASRVSLTNSILWGNLGTTTLLQTQNVISNPSLTNFVSSGAGIYYLAANSPLHQAGTTNVSPWLLKEFHHETTCPPLAFPALMSLSGDLTLYPQAARYTNGSPDFGYYYAPLDYTVAFMTNFGSITVEPGTVIGFRDEYSATLGAYTWWGFDLRENSSFISHGLPTRPVVYTDVQWVQEQVAYPCTAFFVPDFRGYDQDTAPVLDWRFCDSYASPQYWQIWGGEWEFIHYLPHVFASFDSLVNWTMRDCGLHGGRINLGTPEDQNYYYGSGAVTWANNLFEGVSINLDPSRYWSHGVTNCDLSFTANNNLFKGGYWFILEPVPASAGPWTFTDNLFDQTDFQVNTAMPLEFDHNGYWSLPEAAQLMNTFGYWLSREDSSRLTTTNSTSGLHEVMLSYPLAYVGGPYGKYYLDTVTLLYQSGSRTAQDAGLSQYTTFIDQFKDASNQPVNIGLHYVAATNSQLSTLNSQPLDSDGDGVPDYVETEYGTDPGLAITDGTTQDALNAAYDDVDLSGNGLVGRIKKALGLNPLDPNNPLTLKQVLTGEEPDIATFEVPISYDLATNVGEIELALNGRTAQFQECSRATNGKCLLKWNTTFDAPGQCYLAAQFSLNGKLSIGDSYGPDPTILNAIGKIAPFFSTNVCQFNPVYTEYDPNSGGILNAKIPTSKDANYTISLKAENGTHIRTISGSTTDGVISENWDLMDDNNNPYTGGGELEADFTVTPQNADTLTQKVIIHPQDAGFVLDGNFTIAYASDSGSLAGNGGAMRFAIQNGVVDPLLSPPQTGGAGSLDPYPSSFNDYSWSFGVGIPGYLSGPTSVSNLLKNLTNSATRNFYFDGHGNHRAIGNNLTTPNDTVDIFAQGLRLKLQNRTNSSAYKGLIRAHPYRFVFLNACETSDNDGWHNAFGIYQQIDHLDLAVHPGNAQAFVGWVNSPRIPFWSSDWYDIAVTYALLNQAWMDGIPLDDCLDLASREWPFSPTDLQTHLDWPLNKNFIPVLQTWRGFPNNFKLKIYGYAGLKRHVYDANPRHDSSWYYQNAR